MHICICIMYIQFWHIRRDIVSPCFTHADYDIYIYICYIRYVPIIFTHICYKLHNLFALHLTFDLVAMEVCFLTSGETLIVLEDELQGQTAKTVKKALAAKVGISRFKQRLFVGDGSHEIEDDEVLDPARVKIQLVVLEFWPTDDEETQKMISACRENNFVALEQLLQHPRNPNDASKDGKTPLFYAAGQGHVRLMELLLEAGAKRDQPDFARGRTPLFIAARDDHLDTVRFLVEVGAAKDQADNDGATPLLFAAQNGHFDIVRFLVEVGAAKDQADNDGTTPLLVAAQNGHLDIVRFLVEAGAAKDQATNNMQRPCWLQLTMETSTLCGF